MALRWDADANADRSICWGELLDDVALRQSLGERARKVVLENQGATARTVDRLIDILDRTRPTPGS